MARSIAVVTLVWLVLLSACTGAETPAPAVEVVGKQVSVAGGNYMEASAAELDSMLAKKDFILVNVHIPFEGNIANTDESIPYDQVAQNLDRLPDKQARIVLYCRSGRMSAMAAESLVSLGYTNVWDLAGGMSAWEQAGFKIDP